MIFGAVEWPRPGLGASLVRGPYCPRCWFGDVDVQDKKVYIGTGLKKVHGWAENRMIFGDGVGASLVRGPY